MTAEAIAKVMRDFHRGSVELAEHADSALTGYCVEADVVDVQPLYEASRQSEWRLYEDSVCRPPLLNAAYAWENVHGNVFVWHVASITHGDELWDETMRRESLANDHAIDWDAVQWISVGVLWVGGYSKTVNQHLKTAGPIGQVYMPINPDGTVQDFRWLAKPGHWPDAAAEGPLLNHVGILARAITFLNCRNVTVLEPARPKAESRRIARTGVTVSEIHITPVGAYRKRLGSKTPVPLSAAGPLSNVRGHVARYGIDGRGLLFGKYSGEYWIPSHTRGHADQGTTRHRYEVDA